MKPKNRFNVQVVFPDITFSLQNRLDVELTPEDVADELEEFVARIRNMGKVPPAEAPPPPIGRELRYDAREELDDVVIPQVDMFRLERMDKGRWWMRLYMPDQQDYVFHITSGRGITITAEVEPR